jgi:hypothetical protein
MVAPDLRAFVAVTFAALFEAPDQCWLLQDRDPHGRPQPPGGGKPQDLKGQ